SAADGVGARRVDELRAEFLPELARLFPRAAGASVRDFFVTREPEPTFRQAPGTLALRGFRDVPPRVHLAGAWTDTGWPATMEGAVRSGLAAAHAALAEPAREEVAAWHRPRGSAPAPAGGALTRPA